MVDLDNLGEEQDEEQEQEQKKEMVFEVIEEDRKVTCCPADQEDGTEHRGNERTWSRRSRSRSRSRSRRWCSR